MEEISLLLKNFFEKEKSIGRGGYGEVFLAKQISIGEKVALKVLHSNVSPSMKKLIESCWDKEPENKPSFEQIYDMFAKKQVYIPQTNLHKIDVMIEYISKKVQKK